MSEFTLTFHDWADFEEAQAWWTERHGEPDISIAVERQIRRDVFTGTITLDPDNDDALTDATFMKLRWSA